jgi:hypothetical protein
MAKTSPTQRSLALLRKEGYTVAIVEKFNFYIKIRQDLFGMFDLVCLQPQQQGVSGIQVTSGSNLGSRKMKIEQNEVTKLWLKCGNRIWVMGWRKGGARGKRKLWKCNIESFDGKNWQPVVL